jgi:hypothetical protein
MNKLSNEIITWHDVPSCNENEIKRSIRWIFFSLDENVA